MNPDSELALDPQQLHGIDVDSHLEQLEQLDLFIQRLEDAGELSKEVALESAAMFDDTNILNSYYSISDKQQKFNSAVESLGEKIMSGLQKAFQAMLEMVIRIKDWFKKKLGLGDYVAGVAILGVAAQQEIQKALSKVDLSAIDKLVENNGKGLEDYRPAEVNSKLARVFDNYKQTLSDMEIDFLTSGTYYRNIQVLVKDWNSGSYGEFVAKLQSDISDWTGAGLDKTKHVGKDARVVREFKDKMQAEANEMLARHNRKFTAIRYMEETHQNTRTAGNIHRLHEFLNKPSALFPHISNLWKTIHFESMSEDDQKLIKSLDQIEEYFNTRIKALREHASVEKLLWPAEDAFLQLCAKVNQDALKAITVLVRISDIIRKSAICAFNATNKSFSYIRHLLVQVKGTGKANVQEIDKCIQAIDARHAELKNLVTY
jgi:hypothetical protein